MNAAPKVELAGNVRILTFSGARIREDFIENVLAAELEDSAVAPDEGHLLLDFTHVETISSLELAGLIRLHQKIKAAGGRLTLFNLSAQVFEVFSITRLAKLFSICREDAATTPSTRE